MCSSGSALESTSYGNEDTSRRRVDKCSLITPSWEPGCPLPLSQATVDKGCWSHPPGPRVDTGQRQAGGTSQAEKTARVLQHRQGMGKPRHRGAA